MVFIARNIIERKNRMKNRRVRKQTESRDGVASEHEITLSISLGCFTGSDEEGKRFKGQLLDSILSFMDTYKFGRGWSKRIGTKITISSKTETEERI